MAKRAKELTITGDNKVREPTGSNKVDPYAPDPKELIEHTPELATFIVREIEKGRSLIHICKAEGMPHHVSFLRWCQNMPELAEEYAKAKRLRAHSRVEDVEGIVDSLDIMVSDKREAYVADIKAKNLMRLAEIGDPASFSPKMQMTHLHQGNTINITMDLTSAQSRPAIDITPSQDTETPKLASPHQGDEVEKDEGVGGS